MDFQTFIQAPIASTIFVMTIITSIMAFSNAELKFRFTLNPFRVVKEKDYPPLLTSALVHADYMHLLFNGLTFYYFAFALEHQIGHWQFLLLYIGAQLASDIPSLIKHKDDSWYNTLGASGAVSGVVLAYIFLYPNGEVWLLFTFPAWLFGVLFLVGSFYAGWKGIGRINHDAHLWGALAGVVILVLIKPSAATGFLNWLQNF